MTATTTISMRLPKNEVGRLDRMASEMGSDRATFLKRALRQGVDDLIFKNVCQAYRDGEITLSKAAETVGISLREMMARMPSARLELNYGMDDLNEDMQK